MGLRALSVNPSPSQVFLYPTPPIEIRSGLAALSGETRKLQKSMDINLNRTRHPKVSAQLLNDTQGDLFYKFKIIKGSNELVNL